MKKLIAALLLAFPILTVSQTKFNVEVECYTRKDLALLLTEYGEVPYAIGSTMRGDEKGVDESFLIVFINQKTQTWSIVEKSKNNLYCILSAGSNFNLITKATPVNSL
jgi:hypothetical protein